jgi:hypothetical protein
MENENAPFVNAPIWNEMKTHHANVHQGVQKFIYDNAEGADSGELIPQAKELEKSIDFVFSSLNDVKIENCKRKGK